jgi:hypothetical protein
VNPQQNKEVKPPVSLVLEGERRSFKRYETNVPLKFWYSEEIDQWQEGVMLDFSLEGLFLQTNVSLLPDTTMLFDFSPYLTSSGEPCLITGHVVWKTTTGNNLFQYGVLFLVVEKQGEIEILEEDDRDKNFLVEILAHLLLTGKAKLKK